VHPEPPGHHVTVLACPAETRSDLKERCKHR